MAAAQQTNTGKLPVVFLKFEKRAQRVRVNETKSDTENACIEILLALEIKKKKKQNLMKRLIR